MIIEYKEMKNSLTEATLLLMAECDISFKLYIAACGDGVGAALHQLQIIEEKPQEAPVTALPPSGDKVFNAFLVIVDRYRETPILLPCHKYDIALYTALLIWQRVISHTGLFMNIIGDRDPKFTSALWNNLHRLFGTKISFFTAYHPQIEGISDGMIQTSKDIIKRVCPYALELKYTDCFTHYWHTRIST
ncbi:hypothetical protein O181_074934 [Austropuccinia psidii MF-1]|uniref:Integrase catalytic domain-containing protein n=1 Tax=Austropuccinia psidii MF-1 TaxID=1389203 RepID=A0A9Q3FA13_9BASI|nr:hypothetical protein [Austropuccinia psidii MF-1]